MRLYSVYTTPGVLRTYCRRRPPAAGWRMMRYCLTSWLWLLFAKSTAAKGRSFTGTGILYQKVLSVLPFALTEAQEGALAEIAADQNAPYKMLRLLQGDVGSGKTVVALLSMLKVVEEGAQAALMAPTEILAKQHYETISALSGSAGIRIGLLTGKLKAREKKKYMPSLLPEKLTYLSARMLCLRKTWYSKTWGTLLLTSNTGLVSISVCRFPLKGICVMCLL